MPRGFIISIVLDYLLRALIVLQCLRSSVAFQTIEVNNVQVARRHRLRQHNQVQASTPTQHNQSLAVLNDGDYTIEHDGLKRQYTILTPTSHASGAPCDVLLSFHSFGSKRSEMVNAFGPLTKSPHGPLLIAFEGLSIDGLPSGWNGAGSSVGVGPRGETCHSTAKQYACHHTTCGASCHRCMWTTCADDVGFVVAVLDVVQASLPLHRVFATGFSAGAQFLFELGTDPRSAARVNAIAPIHGLPHRGFLRHAPAGASPRLLGIWGGVDSSFQDNAYPPFSMDGLDSDTSLDSKFSDSGGFGWYYSNARNTSEFWGQHADCANSKQSAATLHTSLSCTAFCGGRVVECLRSTHEHSIAPFYPAVIWDFFTQ